MLHSCSSRVILQSELLNVFLKVALLTPLVQQAQNLVTIIQKTTTTPGTEDAGAVTHADYTFQDHFRLTNGKIFCSFTETAAFIVVFGFSAMAARAPWLHSIVCKVG